MSGYRIIVYGISHMSPLGLPTEYFSTHAKQSFETKYNQLSTEWFILKVKKQKQLLCD